MMGNDWDLFEIVRSSAGNTAGAAKEDFLNDDDSFSFPNLVDTRNENHDPFGETFYRMAQSDPTTGPSGATGGLGEKLPLVHSLQQPQPWFKVAVSITDSDSPEAYRSRCIDRVSTDTIK